MPDLSKYREELREVQAAHFVMWHDLGQPLGPKGEWRCACGLKFGFSDSAIDHQADALLPVLARVVAEAKGEALSPFAALADKWEREAEPYLPDGRRYDGASDTLRARADCRWLDAYQLRAALRAEASGREGER